MPTCPVPSAGEPAELTYDLFRGRPEEPTLVYCHGLLSSRKGFRAEMLRRWCERKGWSALLFDFRGRGDSPGSLSDITITHHLEDLDAVLGVLPAGTRPLLFGSSLGGLVAAWYTAEHPDRIPACALVAPAFAFVPGLLARAGIDEARAWRRDGERQFTGDGFDLTVSHRIVDDAGGYPELLLRTSYRTPTLIAHGTADESVPYRGSVEFAEGVKPGLVDLHLFAGGDHRLHERMTEIMALTEAFARRHLTAAE